MFTTCAVLLSGKDGTRAFVSGDFTEKGLIEDLTGLSHQDILGLYDWNEFYKKDYKHIGKHCNCSLVKNNYTKMINLYFYKANKLYF